MNQYAKKQAFNPNAYRTTHSNLLSYHKSKI